MADNTKIEWTDATWNPITGCSVVSPGCTNCYAMRLAGTRLKHHPSRARLTIDTKAGPIWNGEVRINEAWLDQPLRWRRPRMIFVCERGGIVGTVDIVGCVTDHPSPFFFGKYGFVLKNPRPGEHQEVLDTIQSTNSGEVV